MGVLNQLLQVVSFSVIKKRFVSSVSENLISGTASITLEAGYDWNLVKITAGESNFEEKQNKGDSAGIYYEQKFTGSLPGKNVVFPADLKALCDEPVLCKLELANGTILLVGNTGNSVDLGYKLQSSGQDYVLEFSRKCENAVFVIV